MQTMHDPPRLDDKSHWTPTTVAAAVAGAKAGDFAGAERLAVAILRAPPLPFAIPSPYQPPGGGGLSDDEGLDAVGRAPSEAAREDVWRTADTAAPSDAWLLIQGVPVYMRLGTTPAEDVGSLGQAAGAMVGRLCPTVAPMVGVAPFALITSSADTSTAAELGGIEWTVDPPLSLRAFGLALQSACLGVLGFKAGDMVRRGDVVWHRGEAWRREG